MTKLNTTIVFIMAALLVLLPLSTSSVFASSHQNSVTENTAQLGGFCGIDVPAGVPFGNIEPGTLPDEVKTTIYTGDSSLDNIKISVIASDWKGTDAGKASGEITVSSLTEGFAVVVGGITYNATAQDAILNPTVNNIVEFNLNSDVNTTADALATAISDADDTVDATASTNIVTVTAVDVGVGGESIALRPEQDNITVTGSGTLLVGDAKATHLDASVTKFAIDVTGNTYPNLDYVAKTSLSSSSIDLATDATPKNNVDLYLQITTIGTLQAMPYTGTITQTLTFTSLCEA